MKTRTFANTGCWLLVSSLVVADILYLYLLWYLRKRYVWSGNTYTDPVACILRYFTPVDVVGVIALAVRWRFGLVGKQSVAIAAVITLFCTLSPLAYGLWLWHKWHILGVDDLSYWAWWL